MPYFSLVLPCYNVAGYAERCVRSIQSQDFADYEIILVDDGSTDQTPAICGRLAAEDGRIRVIHKANGGLSSARNAGLDAACGQYVWFIDSDDWIEPGALQTLYQACVEAAPEIIKFGYFRAEPEKKRMPGLIPAGRYAGQEQINGILRQACCSAGKYCLSAWSHAYSRRFLQEKKLRFVSERIVCSEDYLFNLQSLMQTQNLLALDSPLYTYELRQGSLTQGYKPDLPERYAELHRRLLECAPKHLQGLIDRFYACHLVLGTCMHHEYSRIADAESLRAARANIRRMLAPAQLKQAASRADRAGLSLSKKLQLAAVRWGFEPLFYYLHAVKPGRRTKGRML